MSRVSRTEEHGRGASWEYMRTNGKGVIDWVRAAVVGAGPAGLAVSSRLARAGCHHVVLERSRVGWTWETQRWDSFRLNTPRWANLVPGELLNASAGTFATARNLVSGLERFAEDLPVHEGVEVYRAERMGPVWQLETSRGRLVAGTVVVASGFQNVPRKPHYAAALPAEVEQLHVADYRRPDELDGAVLVVGGGQSGVQIAEDLLEAGHHVYLSTSRVGRLPRTYRGRDAYDWLMESGDLHLAREHADPAMIAATPPQVSGAGGGRTVSYQHLASRGVTLLGRALGSDGRRLELAPDLGANVRFADEVAARFRAAWEKRAWMRGDGASERHHDAADEPAEHLYGADGPASLDLAAEGISSIVWATGFDASIGWLPAGALDLDWSPRLPGLHVVGAPWLTHRASGSLYGMVADAEQVADVLTHVGAAAA
jgi:putative flavoprotein involved in K+ transport